MFQQFVITKKIHHHSLLLFLEYFGAWYWQVICLFLSYLFIYFSVYVICIHDLAWYDQTAIIHSVIQTCAILPQWHGHFVYSICNCLNEVYIIRSTNNLSLSFGDWWWTEKSQSSLEFWLFLLFHTPESSKGSAHHCSCCPCGPQ